MQQPRRYQTPAALSNPTHSNPDNAAATGYSLCKYATTRSFINDDSAITATTGASLPADEALCGSLFVALFFLYIFFSFFPTAVTTSSVLRCCYCWEKCQFRFDSCYGNT